jgi:hypothetical protein
MRRALRRVASRKDDGKLLFCPECAAKAPEKLAPILAGTGPRDRGPDSTD